MKPIKYGQWKRWADAYQGWRDGRAGIPGRPPRPGSVTTGHREALIRLAQDAFAFEYLRYSENVAEPHRSIIADRARLEQAASALVWAESALDMESSSLTESASRRRRLGEAHHPEPVIIQRRRREHHKLISRAKAAVAEARSEQASIEAGLAEAMEEAKQLHRASVTRVERIHEHVHRRLAIYRRSLIRAHDDAAWANAALSVTAPELPRWALPDGYVPEGVPRPPEDEEPELPPVLPEPEEAEQKLRLTHPVTRVGSSKPESTNDRIGYFTIDSPHAAPWHFTIEKMGDGALRLLTKGYSHGPYIDGEPVGTAVLKADDYFDFANYRFTVLSADLLKREPLGSYNLIAFGLGAKSGSKIRLTEMSFVQREKTLLAVLGPSGAGKSSLFSTLLGELPLQKGKLYFQRLSMETQSKQIRERLGYVPQGTALHDRLTVVATLRYGYRLRSAKGNGADAIKRVLKAVNLEKQQDQLLRTLSGGQLRRVSIALELLTDPPLLLLDEPTTGLDAHMDREIMTLLRNHASSGHTVIVVTHATEHLSFAHQILVVVENGAPAYSGPPRQIRKHFKFRMYADLMFTLQEDHEKWARIYRDGGQVKEAERAVAELERRLHQGPTPADEPAPSDEPAPADERKTSIRQRAPRSSFRAFSALFSRQWLLLISGGLTENKSSRTRWHKAKNLGTVLLPLIIAAGSAALAAFVAGSPGLAVKASAVGSTSLALLTTLCVLSGQALTYSDVVGELEIIQREFRIGVGSLPVLSAKWLAYATVAIAQAGVITVVFCAFAPAPQRFVAINPEIDLFIGLAVLTVSAMSLGMLISTVAAKLESAVAIVTLTSIAQIALNGVTSDLSNSSIAWVAALFPDRWGLAAAASSIDLRGIEASRPGLVPGDALWRHTFGQWLWDLSFPLILSAVFFVLAVYRLHVRLRPKKATGRRSRASRRRWF